MAQYRVPMEISMKAANTSVTCYRVVSVNGKNQVTTHATSTSYIFGVAQEDGSATGESIKVIMGGTCRVMCGASVSVGSIVIPQTDTGKCIEQAVNAYAVASGTAVIARILGIALQSGSSNAVIEVALQINNVRFN